MRHTASGKSAGFVQLALPASPFCQRWNDRTHSWRHTSEGGFDSRHFDVAAIDQQDAIDFCLRHHYAGKPGGLLSGGSFGLYRAGSLVGVAVLTNGGFKTVLTNAFPELQPYAESAELGRLVLLDEVPANAESWFLAEAFRRAAAQGKRGIVSFSDPVARYDSAGRLTMPGHIGTIYQASNATYTGLATDRTTWHLPDGSIFNEQAITKIRQQKQGHEYAEQVLIDLGATPRRRSQSGREWWHQARRQAGLTSSYHPGNHRYQFALGDRRQRRAVTVGFPSQPYPKLAASAA